MKFLLQKGGLLEGRGGGGSYFRGGLINDLQCLKVRD